MVKPTDWYSGYTNKTQPRIYLEKKVISASVVVVSIVGALIICLFSSCDKITVPAGASEIEYSDNAIADAIFLAEGGKKTNHPYGILTKYKTTSPRQACLNTIKNQRIRHSKHNCGKDYLTCLRDRYCPVGAGNDPSNLNINWLKNVRYFLARLR